MESRRRALKVAAVSIGAFIVTFAVAYLISGTTPDRSDYHDLGRLFLSFYAATFVGLVVGVSVGVLLSVLARRGETPPSDEL